MSARIYVPGRGMVDLSVAVLDRRVKELDPRLSVERHPQSGDWVVFIEPPREDLSQEVEKIAVYGLGQTITKSADEILSELYARDTVRHGHDLLAEWDRRKEEFDRDLDRKAEEGTAILAEAIEWASRKDGTRQQDRFFMGGKD